MFNKFRSTRLDNINVYCSLLMIAISQVEEILFIISRSPTQNCFPPRLYLGFIFILSCVGCVANLAPAAKKDEDIAIEGSRWETH